VTFNLSAFKRPDHRNLSTGMCMFELLLQTFWAKKTLKKSADLHPRQGRHWNIFTGLNKTSLHNKGWRPAEKIRQFFQHACS
jgi:hypothetical protein